MPLHAEWVRMSGKGVGTLKTKKDILVAYFCGAIEALKSPKIPRSRKLHAHLEKFFEKHGIIFVSIDPVASSFLIGKTIADNAVYAAKVLEEGNLVAFEAFMDKIWDQDKENVDKSDVLIMWVETEEELLQLCGSVGTFREMHRAKDHNKPVWLICSCPLTQAKKHFLHFVLKHGKLFGSMEEFDGFLEKNIFWIRGTVSKRKNTFFTPR